MTDDDVDEATVEHVADLARIDLEEAERERFADEFAEILAWFVALDAVPDIERPDEHTHVLRPDETTDSLAQAEALANADDAEDGYFRGPPVG